MIDQDRDGFIGMDDLKDMYSSLGRFLFCNISNSFVD